MACTMNRIAIITTLSVVFLWGCGSSKIYQADHDPGIDFSAYGKYLMYTGQMPSDDLLSATFPLMKERVGVAVEKALHDKGYATATGEDAVDFIVIIHAGRKGELQATSYGYGGYSFGGYREAWGVVGDETDTRQYDESTLVIDFIDRESKQLAWRGTGSGTVKNYSTPHKMEQEVDEVVPMILAGFPPGKPVEK